VRYHRHAALHDQDPPGRDATMMQHIEPSWRARGASFRTLRLQRPGTSFGRGIACVQRMRIALLLCAVAGCATYQPGSFAPQSEFPGRRATVGCFDLAVERRADAPVGPVLGYRFANRCDHAAVIDLSALAVVGRSIESPDGAGGGDIVLRPYDPRGELHAVALDGRNTGAEALAYPVERRLSQICVDVATLDRAGGSASQWLCFGSTVVGSSSGSGTVGSVR
jgi:hypothetical protein